MKKLFALFLAVILAFSSFSCHKTEDLKVPAETDSKRKTVTLEGVDVKDCTVAIVSKSYADEVALFVSRIDRYSGHKIPVKELSEITSAEKRIILIGASNLDGSHEKNMGLFGYNIKVNSDDRVVVSVDFSNVDVLKTAVQKLVSLISRRSVDGLITLSLKEKDHVGFSFESKLPTWTLKAENTSVIADGVTYIQQHFVDEKGLPYRAYVLKIDPSKAYLYAGSVSDKYDYKIPDNTLQTVMSQIDAAIENGKSPVAAVNADFFVMSGTSYPLGLYIKEGAVIAKHRGRPWCGYTNDGQFVCGASSLYAEYEGKLRTAVGASHVLISDGAVMTNNTEGSHPRTLAGVSEDGTIILAVIDGRQPNVSNGAEFARCAILMLSHGAYNAVNLDGGGSSTMIVLQDEEYKTVNSPSDGELRKVHNSLLIVPKGS
ncbi:MAG: phosphodiester glycosidase family protein [Clostridia bacterium]|nr:phosphodiester glycosidase family protein [Clostridia bacterium]